MNIVLHYYAMLREKAGTSTETVTTSAATPNELFQERNEFHHFNVDPSRIRIAINQAMKDWDTPLSDGDHVTFIPPTAGG